MSVFDGVRNLVAGMYNIARRSPAWVGLDDVSAWGGGFRSVAPPLSRHVDDDAQRSDNNDEVSPAIRAAYIDGHDEPLDYGDSLEVQLLRRQQVVSREIGNVLSTDHPAIAPSVPYWLACLSQEALFGLSRNSRAVDSLIAAESIASVILARACEESGYPPGLRRLWFLEKKESPSVEALISDIRSDVSSKVRAALQRQLATMHQAAPSAAPTAAAAAAAAAAAVDAGTALAVIVHGTWATGKKNTWWRRHTSGPVPPDNLWHYLDHLPNYNIPLVDAPDHFVWSGGNSRSARLNAAFDFIAWWRRMGKPVLDIFAHSHGGNVALLAMSMDSEIQCRRMMLMGTPARVEYVPRASQVRHMHNMYSRHDLIQYWGGWGGQRGEGRTQSDHLGATNHHIPEWKPNVSGAYVVDHPDLHDAQLWKNHRLDKFL